MWCSSSPPTSVIRYRRTCRQPGSHAEALYPVLADFLKPALLARMEVVPYLPLSKETLLPSLSPGSWRGWITCCAPASARRWVIEPEVTDEIMQRSPALKTRGCWSRSSTARCRRRSPAAVAKMAGEYRHCPYHAGRGKRRASRCGIRAG